MNAEWIIKELDKIAEFSQEGKGSKRLAFSEYSLKTRQYVASLMSAAGLSVKVDPIGNVVGRMETSENRHRPAVRTGSHLDSAPEDGKYRGILGILSAIAAAENLKAKGTLAYPLEIIAFTGEEAGRFGISMLGSKVVAGLISARALAKAKDTQGISLSEALACYGLDLKNNAEVQVLANDSKAFLELGIAESRILEKEGSQIGIVENIAGTTKCRITVNGISAHTGYAPMAKRQDALVSAAMIILRVQEIAQEATGDTTATVSNIKVSPGSINTVPGVVEMLVDIRSSEQENSIETLQEIKDAISVIAENQETAVSIEIFSAEKPVKLHTDITALIKEACQGKHVSFCFLNSGFRQDAANMSSLAPSGMIVIPCQRDNGEEKVTPEAIKTGLTVLTAALYELAK